MQISTGWMTARAKHEAASLGRRHAAPGLYMTETDLNRLLSERDTAGRCWYHRREMLGYTLYDWRKPPEVKIVSLVFSLKPILELMISYFVKKKTSLPIGCYYLSYPILDSQLEYSHLFKEAGFTVNAKRTKYLYHAPLPQKDLTELCNKLFHE